MEYEFEKANETETSAKRIEVIQSFSQDIIEKVNYKQKISEIKNIGKITIYNDIVFNHSVDILNDLFDYNLGGYQKAVKIINSLKQIWFPKLNKQNKKYKQNPAKLGQVRAACWSNILSSDGMTITQEWIATDFFPPKRTKRKANEWKIADIGVFSKLIKGDYQFSGIFHYDQENSHDYTTVYKRESKELLFNEWK
ncbi:MAG: hypothetical protein FWG07_09935 [Treponema sp.]|nr:hypothetical protein [Treponema sp.]